jgi:16S rRNA (uracil1498-N3)-methyltransferase
VREAEEPDPVRVYLPALKQERAEWAVTKLTELGVDEIGLLTCDRSAVRLNAEARQRILARWSRVAREASCQSRRVRLPSILDATDVAGAMAAGASMCELDGGELGDAVRTVVVGPEGGWSDGERALGAPGVSLGETVLRAETAAVASGVLLVASRSRASRRRSEAQ